MPLLFVGHGSPMNAIEDNVWSRGFVKLPALLPRRPRAILAVSAHWYVDGTFVTGNARPRTIHDFGGFPQALYGVDYPARGSAELVQQVGALTSGRVTARDDWGLDHGTWSVLVHMFPAADVPVVQLSLDRRATPHQHYALGQALAALRDDDVLVLGSGNIVHNLGDAVARMQSGDLATPLWASHFDQDVADALRARDVERLLSIAPGSAAGQLAHPWPDHWWPLLYAFGASDSDDHATFPIEGFDLGSLSMRTVCFA